MRHARPPCGIVAEALVLYEAEDAEPLVERELRSRATSVESEITCQSFQLRCCDIRAKSTRHLRRTMGERFRDERAICGRACRRDERQIAATQKQQRTLDARRRHEVAPWHRASDGDLEVRFPEQREQRLTRRSGELLGGLALNDERRAIRRMCGVQQPAH